MLFDKRENSKKNYFKFISTLKVKTNTEFLPNSVDPHIVQIFLPSSQILHFPTHIK